MSIVTDKSLKEFNTFNINVKANYFTEIYSEEELKQVLNSEEYSKLEKLILGSGSNILFTKDFDGLIIKNSIPGIKIISEDEESVIVEAGAGVIWDDLVQYCVNKNYGGIENLSLIPGTVGAAPIQNIGAYGQELKETFYELKGVFTADGKLQTFNNADCKLSYRNSVFKNELKDKFIVTSVKLKLRKNPDVNLTYIPVKEEVEKRNISNPTIKDIREIVIDIRKNKLPDPSEFGNAGSFFKNPVITKEKFDTLKKEYPDLKSYFEDENNIKIPAAWLIEKSGWKGKRIGNVGTHEKQPLVIINYGNATGDEIYAMSLKITNEVKKRFDITLENEVNVI